MEYRFKMNFQFPVKANDVGNYFEELHQQHGEINPKEVVRDARDEKHILHPCFEWSDDIAAEKYRIEQAKQLIRCVVIKDEEKQIETRAFVNVSIAEDKPKMYHTTAVVLKNEYACNLLLKQAERDIISFQDKYKSLTELHDILKAMDNYLKI